jgi:hypothetical protein
MKFLSVCGAINCRGLQHLDLKFGALEFRKERTALEMEFEVRNIFLRFFLLSPISMPIRFDLTCKFASLQHTLTNSRPSSIEWHRWSGGHPLRAAPTVTSQFRQTANCAPHPIVRAFNSLKFLITYFCHSFKFR